MNHLPSGYLTVCRGKSPFVIGKPSISMDHFPWLIVSHLGGAVAKVLMAEAHHTLLADKTDVHP
jgi:hypothetical protein